MRCEGYRKHGGVFTLGPVEWVQCPNEAIVILTVFQEGKEQDLPACMECWKESQEIGLDIRKVQPI